MAAVAFAEAEPNSDQLGEGRTVPLRQPFGRAAAGGIAPISEFQALDPADQLDLRRRRRRAAARLVPMCRPGKHEPAAAERDRDIGAAAVAEAGRQIADEGKPVRTTL